MKVRRLTTFSVSRRLFVCAASLLIASLASGCKKPSAVSAEKARGDVVALALAAHNDVAEVRSGLPQGAKFCCRSLAPEAANEDPKGARAALETARNKVQDLRVSKGHVLRRRGYGWDRDQERPRSGRHGRACALAGVPELKTALAGQYVESRGSLPKPRACAVELTASGWRPNRCFLRLK
jgi:hypothetical protein